MILTDDQKRAVHEQNHIALESCPGSGKTRTIIGKLLHCIEDVSCSTRKLCCITYMNSAVDEIESRLVHVLGRDDIENNIEVNTIHAFCLKNIFRQNYWRIDHLKRGYKILTPDDEVYEKLVKDLIQSHSLNPKLYDSFELISREMKSPPKGISVEVRAAYWDYLDKNGLVDFDSILHYSANLIHSHSFIAEGISAKYAWMLVDEFQDTSVSQVKILHSISKHNRTKFFIVGDPNQSIMSFAGAHPELMDEFAKNIKASTDFSLSENFRSSASVVEKAELICPRTPKMQAVGKYKDFQFDPIWYHGSSIINALQDYFFPAIEEAQIEWGECAILAPAYYFFLALAPQFRQAGIPIIGPGARPYKKTKHVIAPLIEEVCCYLRTEDPNQLRFTRYRLKDLIFNCELKYAPELNGFSGDLILFRIIQAAQSLSNLSAMEFILHFTKSLGGILREKQLISPGSCKLIEKSGENIVSDMQGQRRDFDIANLSVDDLGLFASNNSMRLLTFHRAKGREFEAVALIHVHEGSIPYGTVANGCDEESEARRLFYVGMTRAKRILMVFTEYGKSPSRFLAQAFPEGYERI